MDYQGTSVKTRILLVDDDEVCLQVVSGMLRTWSYKVITVAHPVEALSMLRVKQFDLILSDYHMPDMSGTELQKRVHEEFKLPVIIMSSDDRKNKICTSLEGGAMYYLVKPIKPDNLRNVWQYAVAKRKEKAIVIEEINSASETSSSPSKRDSHDEDVVSAVSSVNEGKSTDSKESSKKRFRRKIMEIYEEHPTAPRKAKVVWTNSLHDRFLQAIDILGLDKAVPKRILEVMNVPGLSRENIASHLQKYRLFLKRVAENSSLKFKSFEKSPKSNFAPNNLPSSSPVNEYSSPFQLGFGMVPSFLHGGNPNILQFPTFGASNSSSNSSELVFETSHLPLGQTSGGSPLYGGNGFHYGQNSCGLSSSIQIPPTTLGLNFPRQGQGNTTYSQPKNDLAPLDMSKHMYGSPQSGTMPFPEFNSGISGFINGLALNAKEGSGTIGNNVGVLSSNPPVSNYVGIRLTCNGNLLGGEGGQLVLNNFGINTSGVENNNRDEFDIANLQSMLSSGYETGQPPTALDQHVVTTQGQNNDFMFDTMNGPSLPNDNKTSHQQPLGDDGDHSIALTQQVDLPYTSGQDFLQHPDITNVSYITNYENNAPPNELLVSEFPNLYHAQDNILPVDPFTLQQYNGSGQQMETNTGMASLIPNDRFSSSTHCPDQQPQDKGEQLQDSIPPPLIDQNSVEQMVAKENTMDWEQEEYIESLLGTAREFLGVQ